MAAPGKTPRLSPPGTLHPRWVSLVFTVICFLASGAAWAHDPAPAIALTSPAFATGVIPTEFTCDGANQSPQLTWTALPPSAKSATIILDDPDAPSGDFHHWLVYNLPPGRRSLPADVPKTADIPGGGQQGRNDRGALGYTGPCPPPGPPHHYRLTIYALTQTLHFSDPPSAAELTAAIKGKVLAQARIIATFKR